MKRRSSRVTTRLAGLLLMAVTVGGCGVLAGPSESESITALLTSSAGIQSALDRAVSIAMNTGQTMSSEFRATTEQVDSAITEFNDISTEIEDNSAIASAAEAYAQAANLVTGLLSDGTIDVAAEVMRTQVNPKYEALEGQLLARQTELGGPDTGSGLLWPLLGLAGLGVGVFVYVQRRRPTLAEKLATPKTVAPPPKVASNPPTTASKPETYTSAISGLTLPPAIGEHQVGSSTPEATGPVRNPEALHSVRGGLRTVELKGIIDAALATIADAGWEVAIECPDVSVLVDPLRMRRLLSNLLLSATAHGAEHIGLVAVIVGDKVEINVGHDGSLLRGVSEDAKTAPPEVDHQLTVARQLLGGMHADVRWTNWRGVSLYTIELVRGPDEQAEAKDRLVAKAD